MLPDNGILLNHTYMFYFEREFSYYETHLWMNENWHLSFLLSILYVTSIFGIQNFMKTRKKFELQGFLIGWNIILAIFSIMGFVRTIPEMVHVLHNYGFYHSICTPSFVEHDQVSGYWSWLFVLSKLAEFGDTLFIVLRKQPLIFLHWYHHITVLLYTWFTYADPLPSGNSRWGMIMNYFVHSIMYSYYGLKAAKIKPPNFIPILITLLQILQMIVGCFINVSSYFYLTKYDIENCQVSLKNIKAAFFIYSTYFLLFSRFFYKTYFLSVKEKKKNLNVKILNEKQLQNEPKLKEQ